MVSPLVKICGTTSPADGLLAQQAGADYIGLIVGFSPSPRNVSLATAQEIMRAVSIPRVLLSVNASLEATLALARELQPFAVQLHGDETPESVRELTNAGYRVWKAIHGDATALREAAQLYTRAGADAVLVDARETVPEGTIYGGTGKMADWQGASELVVAGFRVILAGGLNAQNVARAIESVQPWSVDVVSGVEASKGVKDAQKVHDFVINARCNG